MCTIGSYGGVGEASEALRSYALTEMRVCALVGIGAFVFSRDGRGRRGLSYSIPVCGCVCVCVCVFVYQETRARARERLDACSV